MGDPPAAIVFDLDGTLADTVVDIAASLNATLAAQSFPTVAPDSVRLMVGRGPTVLVERALRHLGVEIDDELVRSTTEAFIQRYMRQGSAGSRLYDDVRRGIERLVQRKVPLAVCSNKPHAICEALLEDLGIGRAFSVIQGATAEIPKKPAPDLLNKVLQELHVEPREAMYVGDSETDVQTAHAAGVPVTLVDYGYSDVPVESLGANHTISSIADLDELFA